MAGTANLPGAGVPVIDYEGSQYKNDFWVGQGRNYEDASERLALRRLVRAKGRRIAEIGAGFGRLADLYLGYEQIILFDYSRTLLQDAAQRWGDDPRFVFVAGNVYQLPLATGVLDTLVMVRVMHHLADVALALRNLQRVLHKESTAVLEFASKRNLKAMARWLARRQTWSPFSTEPVEFVKLNFDFHPAWMQQKLDEAGFDVQQRLAVSHFRVPLLKQVMSPQLLAQMDSILFGVGGYYPLSPSVFVQARPQGAADRAEVGTHPDQVAALFVCPRCADGELTRVDEDLLQCTACDVRYARTQAVWDFKDTV